MNNEDRSKLRLVSTDGNDLRITDAGEYSCIMNGDLIVTEKTSATDRPIHCSELNKELRHRVWHKYDTKFIEQHEGKLYSKVYVGDNDDDSLPDVGVIDIIQTNSRTTDENFPKNAIPCYDEWPGRKPEKQAAIDLVNDLYKQIFGAMKEKEISFYSIPKRVINILDGSVMFDLIRYGSSEYTDTVSLGEVLKLPLAPVEFGRIDLGVQYSKNVLDETRIYNCDTNFTAFSFENGEKIVNNLVGDINGVVRYEFLDGILKVTPLVDDINECIISYCTITYGRYND